MTPESLSDGERAVDDLLERAHFAAQHEIPQLVAEQAAALGAQDAALYLSDLQQSVLVPFTGRALGGSEPVSIDATLPGRAFQLMQVLTQELPDEHVRVWVPLIDGTERLGVMSVVLLAKQADEIPDGPLGVRLRRFAALVAELLVSKTHYGDLIVRLRRRDVMDLAAELQWSLLPPLTFSTGDITVAGALEPAYEVAGDTVDYAVDHNIVRAAIFDAMGHGLGSSQLAAVAVAGYRNQRRAGADLAATANGVHDALLSAFSGHQFATGVFVELDIDSGRLRWINAGHPPPLLLRDGRWARSLECSPLPPLGLRLPSDITRPQPQIGEEHLEQGDRVLLYTDGVLEARSPEGEFFGEQRLIDLMSRNLAAQLPAPETMRRVVRALLEHQRGRLDDDASMLLLEWRTDVSAMRY